MIVKNECKVILRCLESVRPIVDYVLVVDTGSTDGTQDLVREWLERVGLPGEVYDEPWRDFAYNRSHALARLREQNNVDYALMLDADDEFVVEQSFDIAAFKSSLSRDLYDVEMVTGAGLRRYRRPQICSNRREFLYRGVLHEFIDTTDRALSWGSGKVKIGRARGFYISSTREGARNQDPDKYRKDAELLEKALSEEKDKFLRSRHTFYLARSYRDAGNKEKALSNFLKRVELGFWADEIYISLFTAGQIQQEMGKVDEALATYRRASQAAPNRAEAWHAASGLCRESKRFAEGYEFARRGLAIPLPSNGLFVEPWRYEYGLLDEFAINAFWIGKYQKSLDACKRLLREGKMPAQMHDRIKKNAEFAADKLKKGAPNSAGRQSIKPVFIHAAPRTSSTWFWLKFRELPSTICFYEPFNHSLNWMTPDRAARLGRDSWHSRHPKSDPYYREYTPLLREGGGVKHFTTEMTMQWFLPEGGLHGKLRPSEADYLSLMLGNAREAGKTPVFGDCWSLGRIWAIKQAYDGFHIFQYRNLWQQWLSYVSYKRREDLTFYSTTVDIIWRDDDPYFQYLVERGLKHAAEPWSGAGPKPSPLYWNRMYENIPRDAAKVRQIEMLPEHQAFALFMGLQIYLYLNAQLCADLQADVTRMARDERYRDEIQREIERKTGLPVSFADIADVPPQTAVEFDQGSVDWDEIREYGRVAAEMLSKYGDPIQLAANAEAFIDDTIAEMRRADGKSAAPAVPNVMAPPATVSVKPSAPGVKTIGLCMIVKNETKLIRRCLESVLPLLDYILVVDTGSTDGTQQMIRDFLAEKRIAGAVIDEPWRDFAWNRSFAMAKLREVEGVDYAMVIDADDTLEIDAGFDPAAFKAKLTADLYDIPVRHGSIAHYRPQLFSNRLPFSFKGVLHEYLEAPPGDLKRETVAGFAVRASTGGARSENPRKYQDDAAVLEQALATETNPFLISRYTFYLAQSYRDAGEKEKALPNYLKRVELGHWAEEIYVSLFEAGNLMAALDRPFDEVIATWERASKLVPGRAEALHAASRYCRDKGKNAQGMEIARRGIELKQPGGLFIQPWIYDYGILDEFSVNAYWAGAYQDSLDSALKLLASDKLPASMVKRIAGNARFARDKLPAAKAPNLGRLGDETFAQQHALAPQRPLHSRVKGTPRILLAILAKQKEPALPLYLECIEALDYPKSSMVLYIRTNNNTDKTEQILRDWVARVGHLYHSVEFDASNVAEKVEQYGEHEWNATRFSVLGRIRNLSMSRTIELECDYYFVADVDNFIRPATLRELVALDLPIASPLLRSIAPGGYYSNYHAEIDGNGYFGSCDQYYWILNRHVRGLVEVPVVHCTYLVRTDVIPQLTYDDASRRYEYVIFSDSARKAKIPQYMDNRQVYGYITFGEDNKDHYVAGGIDQARALLNADLRGRPSIEEQTRAAKALSAERQEPNSEQSTTRTAPLKTLIFCTAFAKTKDKWNGRYRRWLQAIRSSELKYDNILIVDDGSPELPDWTDITIASGNGEIDQNPPPKALFYHFQEHLGRKALFDFPGWYRSFTFAARYAQAHGFEKIIHIESDSFLISSRAQHYFNDVVSGWTTLWCPAHRLPESAIQVIAGESIRKFAVLPLTHPHEKIIGREFELQLPFDTVELRFTGDRYGEHSPTIPRHADYAVQVKDEQTDDYYWWLKASPSDAPDIAVDKAVIIVDAPSVVPREGAGLPDAASLGDGQSALPSRPLIDSITLLVHPKITHILSHLVEMFNYGLNDLGISAIIRNEPQKALDQSVIIFGANLFPYSELLPLAPNSVVFNVENVESVFMTPDYMRLLKKFRAWDYSASNAAELSLRLAKPVPYVKLFYVEPLSRISHSPEKDIDVLFYGSHNQRRQAVVDGLRARGLRVKAVFGVFGTDLDNLIARSKIVINIHFYQNGHLEMIRIFDLLANRCAVVSELNSGEHVDNDLANALVLAPYNQLVEATEALVHDNERRQQVATDGFRAFSRRTPNELKYQLTSHEQAALAPSAVGRWKYCLISSHNTLLFYDAALRRIRHGDPAKAPRNLALEISQSKCRLLYIRDESSPASQIDLTERGAAVERNPFNQDFNLDLHELAANKFSISAVKSFLSSDRDGFSRYNRSWCREWEHYTLKPQSYLGLANECSERKRILIIDECFPNPRRDAGSNAILSHIASLAQLGFDIYFFALCERSSSGFAADQLRLLGCTVVGPPDFEFAEISRLAGAGFHSIYVQRLSNAVKLLDFVTERTAKIIYCLADLHSLRLKRQSELENNDALGNEAKRIEAAEFDVMTKVDAVVTHSAFEETIIKATLPHANVHVVPWSVAVATEPLYAGSEKRIGFVGGYAHSPNVDAAVFLIKEVMPLVWKRDPDIVCALAGSNMPQSLKEITDPKIEIKGHVDNLQDFFRQCCCTVAPLRYGAGLKGKVLDSLAAGVPCVMTSVAAEGVELPVSLKHLIADNASELAEKIVGLVRDPQLLRLTSLESIRHVSDQFSSKRIDGLLRNIFGVGDETATSASAAYPDDNSD